MENKLEVKWWNMQSKPRKQLLLQAYMFSIGMQMKSIHAVTRQEINGIYIQNVKVLNK